VASPDKMPIHLATATGQTANFVNHPGLFGPMCPFLIVSVGGQILSASDKLFKVNHLSATSSNPATDSTENPFFNPKSFFSVSFSSLSNWRPTFSYMQSAGFTETRSYPPIKTLLKLRNLDAKRNTRILYIACWRPFFYFLSVR